MPYPRMENLSKIIHLENFYQNICKKCTNITIKGPFKTMGEEKQIKQTPMKFKKILEVTFTKKLKILKIAGSRAEFLDFDFEI
jgi:hypothetical protein